MHRKTDERRLKQFSSELRNAFVVKNKCEQLKLEKQHKSLDRLRAYESLVLMNKKREIVSLQMSLLSSKPGDNTHDAPCSINHRDVPPPETDGTRRMSTGCRSSVNSASIMLNTFLSSNGAKDARIRTSSFNCNGEGWKKKNQYKGLSRSVSISGLDCFKRKNSLLSKNTVDQHTNSSYTTDSISEGEDESLTYQKVSKLLPPIQLIPLYKQKSLKDLSASKAQSGPRASKMSQALEKTSWSELKDCRYLRRRKKDYPCSASL